MSNYSATVVQLSTVRPHPNADRLQLTNIFGNNVIVGLNTKEGDIGLFFPVESQIGLEFAIANDLLRRKDEAGNTVGGMFDTTRRVRCQKLRGEPSMGFFCPMEYLGTLLQMEPSEVAKNYPVGTEIDKVGDFVISNKYVPRGTKVQSTQNGQKGKKVKNLSRMIEGQFHLHFDTEHLGRNLHKLGLDDLIAITWKMHGTSGITSNCLVKKPLKWYERALQKVGVEVVDTEYDYVFSSRKVIKNKNFNPDVSSGFYNIDIWTYVGEFFKDKLHRGETLYYEIVGYLPDGGFIQKGFDHGCKVGEHKVYVYRITQTNVDGVVSELPWHQVVERCKEIGVDPVPTIFYGSLKTFLVEKCGVAPENSRDFRDLFFNTLTEKYVYDQDNQFCINKVPEEGIVVRKEGLYISNFKYKSFRFLDKESRFLDSGEQDLETQESEDA